MSKEAKGWSKRRKRSSSSIQDQVQATEQKSSANGMRTNSCCADHIHQDPQMAASISVKETHVERKKMTNQF